MANPKAMSKIFWVSGAPALSVIESPTAIIPAQLGEPPISLGPPPIWATIVHEVDGTAHWINLRHVEQIQYLS